MTLDQTADNLESKVLEGIDCPLCGEWVNVKRVVSTFTWVCEICPFVGFEYYTRQDSEVINDYLNNDY